MRWMWVALITGCTGGDLGEPDLDSIVSDYIASTGQTFADCGVADLDQCGDPKPEVATCLLDGFAVCDAVQGRLTQSTVEGDPIVTVFLVVPDGAGGCSVAEFVDSTADGFGSGEITQSDCTALDELDDCPWVGATECQ